MTDGLFTSVNKELIVGGEPPFLSCHASTVARLPDGSCFAAWFAGSAEGADDVNIWGARRISGCWQASRVVMQGELPHWNPVLLEQDGQLFLFYKVGREIASWQTLWAHSCDGGKSWSEPAELVPGDHGGRGPVRNKVIRLGDGSWLAPASLEDGGHWRSFADASRDGGHSWTKSGEAALPRRTDGGRPQSDIPVSQQSFTGRGVIQPTLWEAPDGVHMLMRSTEGFIFRSDSADGGRVWSPPYPTALPNNNSGIDLADAGEKGLFLVCNPVGENWGKRTPLTLLRSADGGGGWKPCMTLEDGDGEYSYPAILFDGENLLITYTWNRKNIAFWTLHLL